MAKAEANVKVWNPDGSEFEEHTVRNARDLVMHAGWHYKDPKVSVAEEKKATEEKVDGENPASFDEVEKKASEDTPKRGRPAAKK